MPSSLERRLADLNEYNAEFDRVVADGSLVRSPSLLDDSAAMTALSDIDDLENIDRQFVKADSRPATCSGVLTGCSTPSVSPRSPWGWPI